MSAHREWLRRSLLGGWLLVSLGSTALAQRRPAEPPRATDDPAAAEEARERQTLQRFLALLERNPRKGTPLDRVYGYHVERGTLDDFVKTLSDRVAKTPKDGEGWMILGLVESQRGRDAAAVAALRQAEAARPDDPLPSYYLGQALILVGQPDEAATALERSLARKPTRNDLLEIFQALGRVYQRAQKNDQALAVWGRLEQLFPGDLRVQEQIATALAEEGQSELALKRFEALAGKVADPFRKVQLAMQAADLKVRLGRTDPALRDFETLLSRLRPDSWLYREVRHKIEEVFLRNDDQAGLAAYYERWIKNNPEDVEAVVRLGRCLASQGRAADAHAWYEKAVKLAPSRRELRLALIGQLAQDQKFAEAAAQYEALDKAEPNNPDTLREWGSLILRDTARPEAERKAAAGAVWRRLLDARPTDAVTAAQVADLFRAADMADDALALYRKAVDLAPGNPQYHEYVGEYLHTLKRPDEAQAAWSKIVAGANRNSKNLARLGEVLAGFGYLTQAIAPLTEAVALEGDDFNLRMKLGELLHKTSRFDDARAQLDAAGKLAEKDEEKTAVLDAQVKNDQAAGILSARIDALRKELDAAHAPEIKPNLLAERWTRLARYLEADTKPDEASRAIDRAIAIDPRSVPAWTMAARIRESAGSLAEAADAFRRLAEIDRRNRTEYLTGVAKIEARLGRVDQALKAGRDLIAAAPGNPEHYQFFAELCFQLGKNEEGLDALRRAVRVNPNESKVILTLAETLAGQYRTEEAIEIYWKAFEKAEDLDAKLGMVTRLTELYLQRNQFDRLLARLQRNQKETQQQAQQREFAICLAQAYASSGDLGMARSELERLLAANARDVQLLQQLSKLSEEEGDFDSAAKYQKQLIELAPSDEGSTRLAQLYVRLGEIDGAQAVWSKQAAGKSQPDRVLQALDSLLANDKPRAALEVTEGLLRKDPRDWEALYREGTALMALDRADDAVRQFRALLDLRTADDEKSAIVKARTRDPKLNASAARPSRYQRSAPIPLEERIGQATQIRMATKLETRYSYSRSQAYVWSPGDFGQARMAALGWMLSQAMKTGKEAELLSSVQAARDKTPRDPQGLWDWYYLCVIREDSTQAYEAARELSRAATTDPMANWAFLNALGSRQLGLGQRYVSRRGAEQTDNTPPLPAQEIDHVLASHRALRQQRPELVGAQVLRNVATELKRAKRNEEGDRLYREAVAGAQQQAQIAGVFGLAAERGDVDVLIDLADRYDRLQTSSSPYYSQGFYFEGPAYAMAQGMSVRAGAKAYDDVFRLLDHYLESARRKQKQQPAAGKARNFGNPYGAGNTPNYQIWTGKTQTYVQISFPLPNEYYDFGGISLLRTAYELFKRDDLSSDLVAHLRKQADAAPSPADALMPRLALSYLFWWDDDKDAAIAEFTRVAEQTRLESDTRLVLAELLEQRGDPQEALAVVDAVKPLDNATTQRREEQALRLAVLTGNLDRARKAAERLFGLRLDTDTQVRLAGQMNQLALHELAEAVLGRARRRAGNKAAALVGLMLQYQRQEKTDTAVQVAQQILRSSTPQRNLNPNVYYPDNPEQARSAAIQVLARSGRLEALIQRAQEQLKATPTSVQLHQTLADYYKAAGQREKARAELVKITELRPDDASLRYQVANQLAQEGQTAAAVEHYKAALKKQPSLFGNNYWQIQSAFEQVQKGDELLTFLEQVDLRSLGRSYVVTNLIQNMLNDEAKRPRAMSLFRKAWKAFPDERMNLISYVSRDDFWQLPETYDYAREGLIPDKTLYSPYGEWYAFEQILSWGADGRVNTLVSRVLDLAVSQNRLEELAGQIEAARKKFPDWKAGKALAALVDCRLGKYDEARKLVREVLDLAKEQAFSSNVPWVIGAELENHGATRELAVAVYESCLTGRADDPYSFLRFDNSPIKRLVTMYTREGRKDDARRVLMEFIKPRDFSGGYPEEYITQLRVSGQSAVARQLMELGYAADAVPIFNQAQTAAESIPPDGPNYVGDRDGMIQQVREGLDQSLQGLAGEDLARTVSQFLDRGPSAGKAEAGKVKDGKEPAKPASRKGEQAIDLVVLVYPRELDKAAVRSLFDESIRACASDAPRLAGVDARLSALRQDRPEDLSIQIASALTAMAGGKPGPVDEALGKLDRAIASSPLETLPPGARANARQRAEAQRLIPLWFVARACRQSSALQHQGDRLAAIALEAARRQSDNRWTLAMLREQGQQALDRGDRRAAEASWGQMLDAILVGDKKKGDRKPSPSAVPAPAAPARPAASSTRVPVRRTSSQVQVAPAPTAAVPPRLGGTPATPALAGNVPLLTLDRFEQAIQVAKLAAAHDLTALAARAVHESLKGGPPVVVAPSPNSRRNRVYMRRNGVLVQDEPADQIVPRVVARLVELEALWQRKGAPADRVYETLRQVVMPEARPAEIFLYAQPIGPAQALRPRSVGAMLAAWAVKADQVDDLARKIDARKSQPLAQLGAGVLRAQLARAAHRDADLNAALGALAERLKKDTLRTTADLALHAALPALDRDETRKAALDLLEVAVRGFEGPDQSEPLATLLLLSARNRFKTGDVEGGRKRLAAYLDTMERGLGDYGGDYVLYQRKVQYRNVATEFARAGLWTDTLDWLGRFVDAPRYSGGDPTAGDVLRLLVTQLASKPAKERDKALRDWTLPTASRQMVRLLSTLGPVDAPPPIFGRAQAASPAAKSLANEDLLSTADALIDAAREAGTLDTLAQEARTAAEKKIENGDVLYLLVELARGKTGEIKGRLEGRLAELVKDNATPADPSQNTRSNPQPQKPRAFPWPDYLVARAALAGPRDDVRGLAVSLLEALVEQARRFYDQVVLARLHRDLATARAQPLGAPSLALGPESGTSRWHAAASRGPSTFVPTRPLWLAHQGLVAHVAGPEQDFLLFDYPLSGSFELSFDAFHGAFAEANFAYAGLIAEPFWMGNNGQITPVGESETIQRPWRLGRPQDFNRVKIQVSPASVRFLVNDHLFHEDKDPSPTSPWLALFTRRERHTAWRNFALSGNPTIPREVRLSQGDRLEGWTCNFFGETQPPRRSTLSTDQWGNQRSVMRTTRTGAGSAPRPSVDADQYDWSARDGVIRGRRMLGQASARNVNRYYNPDQDNSTPSEAAQSLLSYHRPLRDGDVLSYEFLYEPGQVMVHPALDRLAFLLEPAGVRLHWMTTGANDTSGLLADNAVDDPEHRKGTGPLPLKPNDWNTLKLSMKGDVAALELNGQPVFERPVDQGNTRQIGLYHDKELTSVQVRNVVLKGHWPETLTDVDRRALTFEAGPDAGPEAERRARHAAIGEPFFARQAGTLLSTVKDLKPEERYAALADWVLPSADHPLFRLVGDFTPTDPAPANGSAEPPKANGKPQPRPARLETGGELRAPALALVDTARKLDKLSQLAGRVAAWPAEGDVNRRGKLALQALIQMAAEEDDKAAGTLEQLRPLLGKVVLEQPEWTRWPELVAAARAMDRPRLRKTALALLETMAEQAQKKSPSGLWEHQVKNARARCLLLAQAEGSPVPFGTDPDVPGWARVTHARAETRGAGEPIAHWVTRDGQLTHHPGHGNDFLYLTVPLRGDFQLDCELTSFNWRESRVSYGGMTAGLKHDLKHVERFHYGRPLPELALVPPFEKIGDWYPYRLVVKGGRMTTFVDGRKIHEAPLPAERDPWLAVFVQAQLTGSARKIKISGAPEVPDRLNLTALPDLTGWLADYYGDSVAGEDPDWDKRGDEIVGRLRSDFAGARQESVLRYNRPMLEDGEITYEFYYEPGKAMVHPALDRLTFLLEPDGVKIHWMTDAQYDRSGLKPDNAAVEPDNRRGPTSLPLKPKDWNRLNLSTSGDRVALRLNGVEIYSRAIEPTNQRIFGLFHELDQTEARVRSVTYAGQWPRQLPRAVTGP